MRLSIVPDNTAQNQEIAIAAVIEALAQQTDPLPEAVTAQLRQLGQVPAAQLNNTIQDFLQTLDYQPLLSDVESIELRLLNPKRGLSSPPAKLRLENSAEIANTFTSVVTAEDIRQAAQAALVQSQPDEVTAS